MRPHRLGVVARFVLVPIAFRVMVPALTTFATSLLKDSSVCYVIGVVELMQLVVLESSKNPAYLLELYCLMALFFLIINGVGTRLAARLERRMAIPGALS